MIWVYIMFPSLRNRIQINPCIFCLADHNPTEIILHRLSKVLLCQMIVFDIMLSLMILPNIAYYFIEIKRFSDILLLLYDN